MSDIQKPSTVQVLVDRELAEQVKANFANNRKLSLTATVEHLLDMLSKGMVSLTALNPKSDNNNKQ